MNFHLLNLHCRFNMAKPEFRAEAVRLRIEERLSLPEIRALVPVSKGSLSLWLKDHPLTDEELRERRQACGGRTKGLVHSKIKKAAKDPSKWYEMANSSWGPSQKHNANQRGLIAEAAVLFRLTVNGFLPLRSIFEGHKADWLVDTGKSVFKVQVKCVHRGQHGAPTVSLRTSGNKESYLHTDFDYLVGYDLFTDVAYVFTWEDVKSCGTSVTVRSELAEAWWKLRA